MMTIYGIIYYRKDDREQYHLDSVDVFESEELRDKAEKDFKNSTCYLTERYSYAIFESGLIK